MPHPHVAHPGRVILRINGTRVELKTTQVSALRGFDTDGVLRNSDPDLMAVRALARRGWVLRSRGHFVLTPQGRVAQAALAAYFARKNDSLDGGAAS